MTGNANLTTNHSRLFGIDHITQWGCNELKFECHWSAGLYKGELDERNSTKHNGYYIQYVNECEGISLFGVVRYDDWIPEFDRDAGGKDHTQNRVTLATGYRSDVNIDLRVEYFVHQFEKRAEEPSLTVKLAFSFRKDQISRRR